MCEWQINETTTSKRLHSIAQGRRAAAHPGLWHVNISVYAEGVTHHRQTNSRRALSLVEVVASTMIVGLMTVAALNSLGAATRSSESIGNRAVAIGLADELMSEILQAAYEDPNQTPVFGHEGGEPSSPRSAFDDVDDYELWNESPPKYRDGTTMPDRADWRHSVRVRRVVPGDVTQTTGTEQGAKRIRVTIEYRGQVLADQFAVRTNTDEK